MTKPNYQELLQKLSQVIEESLSLLKQAAINDQQKLIPSNIPVTSLLDQCVALCEQYHADVSEPIRVVHHFGLPLDSPFIGSLATLPNTRLLMDINPGNSSFKGIMKSQTLSVKSLADTFIGRRMDSEDSDIQEMYLNDLQYIQQQANKIGQRLLICNNHCSPDVTKKDKHQSDLQSLLNLKFETKSVVIVVDPIIGYQVYCERNATEPSDLDFEQYCQQTLNFIQANPNLTVMRHEDFMLDPATTLQRICELLDLPFNEDFMMLKEVFK